MAKGADEAKTRLLAVASHEVRTPLIGIMGMAELLASTDLTAEQLSYVEAIRRSAESLASLTSQILDFSKIEAGKLGLRQAVFDLSALIEGVAELLAPRAQGKGIEIATSIDRKAARLVTGDPERLRQVLLNLAGNAVKFTESGGVGIAVEQSPSGEIRFSVSDTGPGVPAERRESIFHEFEQADDSYFRTQEGVGLGLAISRSLVNLMGGDLRLTRSDPNGSVFSFAIQLPGSERSSGAPAELADKSALIVAKSPFGGPYLVERMAELGATAIRVDGEAAALAFLRQRRPDVVIIDCDIGEAATRRLGIAARSKGVAKSLILFSPFERRTFGEAVVGNFDGWLVKPIRRNSLYSRLVAECRSGGDPKAAAGKTEPGKPLEGRKILVAEDNDVNAMLVERTLSRLGAYVIRVRDGAEAVALACGDVEKFDAVLMDVRMPGLDGLDAAKRIRAAEEKAGAGRVRIVALTADIADEDRAAVLQAGMDVFIAKPADPLEIVRVMAPEIML